MSRNYFYLVPMLASFACAGLGCMGSNANLSRCQAEKTKLLARIEDEKSRAENLDFENRSLNRKLDEAEKQLAQLHDNRGGQRMAEFKRPPAADNSPLRPTLTPSLNPLTPSLSPLNAPLNDSLPANNGWVPKGQRSGR